MNSRSQVSPLIQEIQEACRRPLFTEVCLDDSKQDYGVGRSPQQPTEEGAAKKDVVPQETGSQPPLAASSAPNLAENPPKKSWRELVMRATELLPFMTENDHGEVSQLISVLLLGFLLPHSTGNEYFLMQNVPELRKRDQEAEPQTIRQGVMNYILHMDLEERLESTCRHHAAFEFGEFNTLTDSNWEVAFDAFVNEGLAPFLSSREAHLQQVDLLHILAMAIHPQPSESFIPDTVSSLEGKHFWEVARKLMKNRHAHSFHANYSHRLKMVKLIVKDLVIPAYDPEMPMVDFPLFDGALPHLRAALHAFAVNAVSIEDAYLARSALVTVAIQSRTDAAMKEEWEFLINRMVDDRTRYPGCKSCPRILEEAPLGFFRKGIQRGGDNSSFCPHAGRGQHLADFLIRTCEARRQGNVQFLNEAFSSLTDAIEWQTHCWKQPDDAEPSESEETPSMLASLLFAAKQAFYFLLPEEEKKEGKGDQDDNSDAMMRRDELLACATQLCHHVEPNIACQAAELVSLAYAYASKRTIEESAQALCLSLRLAIANLIQKEAGKSDLAKLESERLKSSLQRVISAASRRSPSFALSFLNLLLQQSDITASEAADSADKDGDVLMKDTTDKEGSATSSTEHLMLQLIASIALANPVVAGKKMDAMVKLLKKLKKEASRIQVTAALMATRQARFFLSDKDPGQTALLGSTTQILIADRWNLYQLGRLALRTGNWAAASKCYNQILKSRLSERYFVWITALIKISDSELSLTKHAAMGIPAATTMMRSALSTLVSLNSLDGSHDSDFSFQISCVRLRLDFLDLLAGLRHLIREMRLTGSTPAKRTRSFLHFLNIMRCFDALANRYLFAYRQYGLFSCQQTRTSLRTLFALCRFLARTVRVVFSDAHLGNKKDEKEKRPPNEPTGDTSCPVTRFMQRLEEGLLHKMNSAIDPVIRAAAMLEVVDGLLLCPVPFPMRFLVVSALPTGTLQLHADPEEVTNDENRIDCYPGLSFGFCASGTIPNAVLAKSKLPFTTVLLWHRAGYAGPLQEDEQLEKQEDEHMADEKQEEDAAAATKLKVIPRPWNYTLVSTGLLRNGNFSVKVECPTIREEGNYVIEAKLGCRDIRGGEWEIPICMASDGGAHGKLDVQVSRSGWHA